MDHHQDCHVTPSEKAVDESALRSASTALLAVDGMGCERCAVRVGNSLLQLDAVLRAQVDADQGVAAVAFDSRTTGVVELLAAVEAAGNDGRHRYRARLLTLGDPVEGEPETAP